MKIKVNVLKTSTLVLAAMASTSALAANPTIQGKIEEVLDIVQGCGIAVVTGTVIWAGFKIGWQGESLRNVQGPLIGGLIVGCAAYFAGLLLG